MQKQIALLGSTGSIGKSTLEVIRHLKDEIQIVALAAKSNIDLLELQAKEFSPEIIAVFEEKAAYELQKRLPSIPVLAGMDGLKAVASFSKANFVMLAMAGTIGLQPTLTAIESGKQVGIANKETLVSAGDLITNLAKKKGICLLPVDSEMCALFQCLQGESSKSIRRLIITGSGGPLREKSLFELEKITWNEPLTHPHFQVGARGMVDSSTLMNKGLEMMVARWLFDVEPARIELVIHPEQRVQSCVEFIDGSLIAQIAEPNMLLPIQYALSYPKRRKGFLPPYDFLKNRTLSFLAPDKEKFRCLKLAIDVMKAGRSYPSFLMAANEVLVERFLDKKISWMEIGTKLEKLISSHEPQNLLTLEAILELDGLARRKASVV
jgi:1-deoxy-D-xylulose-5-phosphate reductoisomerase